MHVPMLHNQIAGILHDLFPRENHIDPVVRADERAPNSTQQQRVLAEIAQLALDDHPLDDLFDKTVERVANTLNHDYCKILELRPDHDELLLRNGVGWRDGIVGTATVETERNSQAGYTLLEEEPVVVTDLPSEDRFTGPALLTSHGVKSGISTIIGTPDDPWGILGVHTTTVEEYTDDDVEFIRSVANILFTEIRRRQREDELAAQNERLDAFASMLAHELRNPVTIGQIYSEQLPEDSETDAVTHVQEAFDRIEDMVDVLLVLARGRDAIGENDAVVLADVAHEVWMQVNAPDARLVVNTDRVLQAEETYIRHLLENLFENAVEHGGSDVTITIGDLPEGFYVADDGTGIPADDREDVFDIGFTTAAEAGGTGLGLAFVQELADVYDWSCSLSEGSTGGARFEFESVDFV
ncbi:GAF domain-containing sensor histidine kinase [Halorussus salinisoli]|uniref:GAF domain-containing sensor histidine kinase n=1 Tax=Halorussus salinisoli TaxID=2558242 RepID=UPI0010C170C4|nr:GAF domain-containing sensor histidine kinase [Halorussus salinisoli]